MPIQEKQLGQARENSTNAVSVYSPGTATTAIIKNITVANTSGSPANLSIYIDDNGTVYDESTVLIPGSEVDEVFQLDVYWPMNNSNGNLAYKSSVANALTISVFGAEIT